jgi:transcription initiation factor TFIIB
MMGKKINNKVVQKCLECGCRYLISNNKEIYCSNCGLVIAENIIDPGREWRAYDTEQYQSKTRIGPQTNWRYYDKGLSTATPPANKIPNLRRPHSKYISIQVTSKEKILAFALSEMHRICSALQLPEIAKEEAAKLCHNARKKNLFRGRSAEGIAAATVYIVCKEQKISRTLLEIEKISRVKQKEIRKTYMFLQKKLELKTRQTSSAELVPRFCSELGLNNQVKDLAIKIIDGAEKQNLIDGKPPRGIAAAAIYIACFLKNTHCKQKDICRVAGITAQTLRTRHKKISEKLEIGI